MFHIEIRLFTGRVVESLPNAISIVGMNSLKCLVERWLGRSIVLKDGVGPVRPVDLSARNTPAETAGLADPLALSQESFAALQVGIKPGILQRNGGFRMQQFRHRNAVPREGAWGQGGLEEKHAENL